MKSAMKKREKERLSVIRMARASIKNVEIEKRKDLDDQEVIEVMVKEVKQRKESIEEYEKAGKDNLVDKLKKEIDILLNYLPRQLTRKEIERLVDDVIIKVGAKSVSDMGKVMSDLMFRVKGRADGGIVNQIVQEKLS
jgi:uncharacterized protein